MVLKDVQCRMCGGVSEEMVDGADERPRIHCTVCDRETRHLTICTGGTKAITWGTEGVNAEDYVEQLGVKAGIPRPEDIGTPNESKNAEPVRFTNGGGIVHESTRFTDGVKENQAKRRWARERAKNGPKIHFH